MDRPRGQGEDLVDEYPENVQGDPDFNVGGVDRPLPDALQLEQLVSYIEATYDPDSPQYLALLPDRITHAAMLMLGSAVDHTMPGVAYTGEVASRSCPLGELYGDDAATWVIALWDGPDSAMEHWFRPEAAAVAQLSGATVLVSDRPDDAVAFAREQGAETVAVWAFSTGSERLPRDVDALALTFPTKVADLGVPTFLQVGTKDELGAKISDAHEYHSTHYIQTPAEARRRVRNLAEFFRNLGPSRPR